MITNGLAAREARELPRDSVEFDHMRRAAAIAGSRFVTAAGARPQAELDAWVKELDTREKPLTVLEYTTLLFAARANALTDKDAARTTLERAYRQLTGVEAPDVLETRLPLRVLSRSSRDERVFHVAAFRSDNEPGSRLGAIRDYVPTATHALVAAGTVAALCAVPVLGMAALGLGAALALSSVAESAMHELVGHTSPALAKKLEKRPKLRKYIMRTRFGHAVVHHGKTYKNYVDQFRDAGEKARLDGFLLEQHGEAYVKRTIETRYGASLSWPGASQYIAPLLPILGAAAWATGFNPAFMAGMLPILVTYPLHSGIVHEYFHKRTPEAFAEAGPLMRLCLKTPFARFTSRQHWDHHRGSLENFNLSPGAIGDVAMKTVVPLSIPKLLEIRRLGIIGS